MYVETFKHFKYEIALGKAIPMPKPTIDYYPNYQYSVQLFLHALCKTHVGSLGKIEGKWSFGENAPKEVRLSARFDIIQIFDYAEKMGIIEPKPSDSGLDREEAAFIPYQLSKAYWDRFDKYAQ